MSFDGPIFPPSWKLITEVYDPARAQSALQRVVEAYNSQAVRQGRPPLRTGQETAEGRTYYMIAGPTENPLTEAHYTFANGYLIAGPTRALVSKALQIKTTGTSIAPVGEVPGDGAARPIRELLGGGVPEPRLHHRAAGGNPGVARAAAGATGQPEGLAALQNLKPMLLAAYAEGDRITVAAGGNVLAQGLSGLLNGNLTGMIGGRPCQFGPIAAERQIGGHAAMRLRMILRNSGWRQKRMVE